MDVDKICSLFNRVLFPVAFVLLTLAVIEALAYTMGYTVLRPIGLGGYTPGRLLELASAFALFVAVLLLRQVREEIRRKLPG